MDTLVTSTGVAKDLGTTVSRIHRAIARGEIVARGKNKRGWLLIPKTEIARVQAKWGKIQSQEGYQRRESLVLAGLVSRWGEPASQRAIARITGLAPTTAGEGLRVLERRSLVMCGARGWTVIPEKEEESLRLTEGVRLPVGLATRKSRRMPKEFRRYFWDLSGKRIFPTKDANYVIGRLVERNDPRAWVWIKLTYSQDEITEVVAKLKNLDERKRRFFVEVTK